MEGIFSGGLFFIGGRGGLLSEFNGIMCNIKVVLIPAKTTLRNVVPQSVLFILVSLAVVVILLFFMVVGFFRVNFRSHLCGNISV